MADWNWDRFNDDDDDAEDDEGYQKVIIQYILCIQMHSIHSFAVKIFIGPVPAVVGDSRAKIF